MSAMADRKEELAMSDNFFDGIDDALTNKHTTDQEQSDAPKFDPEEGDVLHGILLTAKAYTGGSYDPTIIITFKNVGEEEVGGVKPGASGALFTPTVLRRQLLEAQPAPGKPFALKFEGVPEGKSYKDWTLLTAYMKTGNQSDIDPALWSGIARTIAENTMAPQQRTAQNAQPGDSAWKF